MAEDVVRYADSQEISNFELVGHALGGKLAMTLGMLFPDRVDNIISIEAAPIDNTKNDPKILEANTKALDTLLNLEIEGKTRKAVIDMLNSKFEDKGIAALVSMNIIYDGEQSNTVKWCTNLQGIKDNLQKIVGFEFYGTYEKPFLAIYGELSKKFPLEVFQKVFPNATPDSIIGVPGGHWVHYERQDQVLKHISKFYKNIDS